jgi:hypothetical protein
MKESAGESNNKIDDEWGWKVEGSDSSVKTVKIDDIVMDIGLQVRKKLDSRAIERYADNYALGRPMDPIKVARVGKVLKLVNGWHRIAALRKIGMEKVQAEIVECRNDAEAGWIAAEANLKNAVPLRPCDTVNVFRMYMRAKKYKNQDGTLQSLRVIRDAIPGVKSHNTIQNWMKKFFPVKARMWKDEERGRNTGGVREGAADDRRITKTKDMLSDALASFKDINDLDARVDIIKLVETMVEEMKQLDIDRIRAEF